MLLYRIAWLIWLLGWHTIDTFVEDQRLDDATRTRLRQCHEAQEPKRPVGA